MISFKNFIKENIDVIVTGNLMPGKIDDLVDTIDFSLDSPAKVISSTINKAVVNFKTTSDAQAFVLLCKSDKLKATISNTLRTPNTWLAYMVPKAILGVNQVYHGITRGDPDEEDVPPGKILVMGTWLKPSEYSSDMRKKWNDKFGVFSPVDEHDPKKGGCIGLADTMGSEPEDIGSAAHESFHAFLFLKGGDWENEFLVNDMAEAWIMRTLTGSMKQGALDRINLSRGHYTALLKDTPFKTSFAVVN